MLIVVVVDVVNIRDDAVERLGVCASEDICATLYSEQLNPFAQQNGSRFAMDFETNGPFQVNLWQPSSFFEESQGESTLFSTTLDGEQNASNSRVVHGLTNPKYPQPRLRTHTSPEL